MASQKNAFDLLVGAENVLGSKKKNKNKKAQADAAETPAAPVQQVQSSNASKAPAVPTSGVVEVAQARAIFEAAAREARSIGDRCKLWRDWIKQAGDKSGKGLKYKEADGSYAEFSQVLVGSNALSISVSGAVGAGLSADREELLAQLLGTFYPHSHGVATTLVRLSALIEDGPLDTKGAAQRAVDSVLTSLRGKEASAGADKDGKGAAVSTWLSSITKIDKDIAHEQALLQKLLSTSRGVVSKEQAAMAKSIYKLLDQKFNLLLPENVPAAGAASSGARDAGLRSIDELKKVINSHLRDAHAAEEGSKAGKGGEASKAATLASLKREEGILAQQADSVAGQIRTLEAQLRSLRSQQAEIEERRAQIQQRQRVASDPAGGKGRGPATFSAAHHREELALADALAAAVDPARARGASPEQVSAAQTAGASAPLDLVTGGHRYLELSKSVMADLPTKMASCRQRLNQAEKLIKLGSKEAGKVKDEADKLMSGTLKTAEETLRGALQVVAELNQRYDAISRVAPDQAGAAATSLRSVDALMAEIRAQYDVVQAAAHPEAAAPAPVAAPAPAAAAPAARPASAAPAPAARAAPAAHRPASAAPAPKAAPAAAAPAPAPAPVVAAPAPVAAAPAAAANGGSKSAFDAAAEYLAKAQLLSSKPAPAPAAVPKPEANGAAPKRPVHTAAATPSAPRTWGKVHTPAAPSGDSELPTPAEAFKAPTPAAAAAPSTSAAAEAGEEKAAAGGSGANKKKQNRQKA